MFTFGFLAPGPRGRPDPTLGVRGRTFMEIANSFVWSESQARLFDRSYPLGRVARDCGQHARC